MSPERLTLRRAVELLIDLQDESVDKQYRIKRTADAIGRHIVALGSKRPKGKGRRR